MRAPMRIKSIIELPLLNKIMSLICCFFKKVMSKDLEKPLYLGNQNVCFVYFNGVEGFRFTLSLSDRWKFRAMEN